MLGAFLGVFFFHRIGFCHQGLWELGDASLSHFQGHRISPTHTQARLWTLQVTANIIIQKKVIHPIGEVTHWWSEKQLLPEWYQSHLLDHIKGGANIDIDVTHIGNIWPFSSDHLVSQARFVEDLMMY